jgi:photosystem II stability/assembly factor-like uncharacterized protein
LYRSIDGGYTWNKLNQAPSLYFGGLLTIDPQDSAILYATFQSALHRSADSGVTWKQIGSGLPLAQIDTLTINPLVPTTLYASVQATLYRSADSGATWSPDTTGLPPTISKIVALPQSSNTLYAATDNGVYRSEDAGATWQPDSPQLAGVSITGLAASAGAQPSIYASTSHGIFIKLVVPLGQVRGVYLPLAHL